MAGLEANIQPVKRWISPSSPAAASPPASAAFSSAAPADGAALLSSSGGKLSTRVSSDGGTAGAGVPVSYTSVFQRTAVPPGVSSCDRSSLSPGDVVLV